MAKHSVTKITWTLAAVAVFAAVIWSHCGAIYHDPTAAMYMAMMGLGLGIVISREFGRGTNHAPSGAAAPAAEQADRGS